MIRLLLALTLALGCLLPATPTDAQFGAEWYMLYRQSRSSSLTMMEGPYPSEWACRAAKWELSWPQVFVDCVH